MLRTIKIVWSVIAVVHSLPPRTHPHNWWPPTRITINWRWLTRGLQRAWNFRTVFRVFTLCLVFSESTIANGALRNRATVTSHITRNSDISIALLRTEFNRQIVPSHDGDTRTAFRTRGIPSRCTTPSLLATDPPSGSHKLNHNSSSQPSHTRPLNSTTSFRNWINNKLPKWKIS